MKSFLRLLFQVFIFVNFVFIFSSCSTEIEPVNPFDPETSVQNRAKGGITGKITPEDILDLKRITFTVTIQDSQFNAVVSEDGSFNLNALPQGNYYISVISSDKSYKEEKIGPFEVKAGQTVYAGNIPVVLKKGILTGYFTAVKPDSSEFPVAFVPVFVGKTDRVVKTGFLKEVSERCMVSSSAAGYLTSTDGSGRIHIENIRVGKYRALLTDSTAGIGVSQEFEVKENEETDLGEIAVTSPVALLHAEEPDNPGVAIDVTSKNIVRVVFGLQNFTGEAMVFEGDIPAKYEWQDISQTNYYDLTVNNEGLINISVKFRDLFCRESPVFKTTLFIDRTKPVVKNISVDDTVKFGDNEYSKNSTVKIRIEAADDFHDFKSDYSQMKMKITTDDLTTVEWEDFNTVRDYYLGEQDGNRQIKIILRDKAGNISESFTKNIILDRTPPKDVSMIITGKVFDKNGLLADNNNLSILQTLRFKFTSDSIGGKVFLYENSGTQILSCENMGEALKEISLVKTDSGSYAETDVETGGQSGEKSFYACFTDAAGNIRTTPVSGKIYLDRSPPSNVMFRVNYGSMNSSDQKVKLTNIGAYDDYTGNLYLMISGCPDFSKSLECRTTEWLDFTSEVIWDTGGTEGLHDIFLKARDLAGNESATAYSSVNIDLTDPEPPYLLSVFGKEEDSVIYTNSIMPILMWNASPSSDVEYYEVQVKQNGQTEYTSYKTSGLNYMLPSLSEGRYNFRVRAVDRTLRSSPFADGPDFVIDTTVPTTPRFEKINYSVIDLSDAEFNEFRIRLAVLSSDENFKEYRIKGGVYSEFISAEPDNLNYLKFYLLKDSINNLQIKAVDKAGNESSADFAIITEDSRRPLPPSNIRVIEGNGKIYVKWDSSNSKDVAGYRLYYGFTNNPPFAGSFAAEGISPIDVGNNTIFGLSSLLNFTKFYVTVTAYDRTENVLHESIMPQAVSVYPTPVSIEPAGIFMDDHTSKKLIQKENLIILLDNNGLRIFDISEPEKPKFIEEYKDYSDIFSMSASISVPPFRDKGFIYLGKRGYIDIIELKNGAHLKFRIATGLSHTFISEHRDYIISSVGENGFRFYKFIDDNTVEETGIYESDKIITSAFHSGNYLYYTETKDYTTYTLHIADITNIENIREVGTFRIKGYPKWINVVNNRLYTAFASDLFKDVMLVLDISDISKPVLAGTYKGNMINMADSKDNYIYLLDSENGLIILDQSGLPDFLEMSHSDKFRSGSDIKVTDRYAYIADGLNGLSIVDILDKRNPVPVFSEQFDRFYPRRVVVQGAYAYVANRNYPKIVILDISDPENIRKMGELPLASNPEGVFIHGNHLYIAGGTDGLIIADVSEPTSPKIIGSLKGKNVTDVFYLNGFVFGIGGTSFYSFDVKNPASPVLKKELSVLSNPQRLTVRGKGAYVADGSGGLKVINLNDPANPVFSNSYSTGDSVKGVVLSGKRVFLAEENSGLRILEVNNIENPTVFNLKGNFKISGITNAIAMTGSYVYLLSASSGIWVIDVSNPSNDLYCPGSSGCKGFYELNNRENKDLFTDGTMIYIAQDYSGLEVYEIASPTIPVKKGLIKGSFKSHIVDSGYLFASDSSSLKSYDVINPENPVMKANYEPLNSPNSVAISGNYIYTSEYTSRGIQIFDVTDPSVLNWIPNFSFNFGSATNISVFGRTIFLSQSSSVKILDFTTPYDIVLVSTISEINTQRVVQQGNYIYLPNWQFGLAIYDIRDKSKPAKVSNFPTKRAITAVDVRGDFAYLAAESDGLLILDITNPASPVQIGSFSADVIPAYNVKVYNNVAYIACALNGFSAINVKDPKNPYLMAKYEIPEVTDIVSVQGNTAFVQTRSGIHLINLEP